MQPYPFACDALNAQAVDIREYHYQTGHGGRKGQVSYKNTDKVRSLLQGTGHGVSVSMARCLSNVLNCFIQLSKND